MRKYSRRHGWMKLRTYASGDGSISLAWESETGGEALPEPVTESDVSELLRLPENGKKWEGWEIVSLQGNGKPSMKLARMVKRPFGSHKKLVMDGKTYEYSGKEMAGRESSARSSGNTTFMCEGAEVSNMDVMSSLLFFLNHELDFRASGLETREQA